MALSNWDTFAINERGESNLAGELISPLGIRVKIYKNFLYVSDANAWQNGDRFVEPIVMRVELGEIAYKDVEINAVRGPQDGIYVAVIVMQHSNPESRRAMIGIGCSGYSDAGEWIGTTETAKSFLRTWLDTSKQVTIDTGEPDPISYTRYKFEDWVREIKLDNAHRYNQGDAFLAEKLGFDTPTTLPGKSALPNLVQDSAKKD